MLQIYWMKSNVALIKAQHNLYNLSTSPMRQHPASQLISPDLRQALEVLTGRVLEDM